MGNSAGKGKDQKKKQLDKRSQGIDHLNMDDHSKERKIIKLLLLGAGESGKSTLFKQSVHLFGSGFDKAQLESYTQVIYRNILQGMFTLVEESDRLPVELKTRISPELKASKEFFLHFSPVELSDGKVTKAVATHVNLLWPDPGVQACFAHRARFQLPDCVSYFFQPAVIDRIAGDAYSPVYEDVLRCRSRTTGIVETQFAVKNDTFKVIDVGGQRSERKKWIHCFEDVTAVLFVAAISEYDQVLFEDNVTNRIAESLELFDKVCNAKWFQNPSVILFLNKRDLFEDKIRKVDMKCCFPEYTGGLDNEKAIEFLIAKFRSLNKDPATKIYCHVTCATDPDNVKFTFEAVKKIVIHGSLLGAGLA